MQAILDMFDERVQEIDLYFDAIKELDESVFVLRHIQEKYAFNLKNIF